MRDPESVLVRMRAAEAPAIELVTDHPPAPPRSVALLSGSFDPVTVAHVGLAEAALTTSERVLFVYSVRTLPKEGRSAEEPWLLTEPERVDALVRVTGRDPRFAVAVCSRGLLADQVEAAAVAFPEADLSVVAGSDKLLQLFDPKWYEDREAATAALLGRAMIRYGIRPGDEGAVDALLRREDVRPWRERLVSLDVPREVAWVSSSLVRARIRSGHDVRHLVPREALARHRGDPVGEGGSSDLG